MGVGLKLQKWCVNPAGFDDSPRKTHFQTTELYDSKIDFKKGILRIKRKEFKKGRQIQFNKSNKIAPKFCFKKMVHIFLRALALKNVNAISKAFLTFHS